MIIYYAIAGLIILLDQVTKWLVVKHMDLGEEIVLVDPYLSFLSHRNPGAAWGMLAGQMWLFTIVTIVVIVGLLYFFYKEAKGHPLFSISLMVLLGGAIGNFIDRLAKGEVVDFISVWIPIINYDFPIFNIADAALTVGVILLILHILLDERKNKEKVPKNQ